MVHHFQGTSPEPSYLAPFLVTREGGAACLRLSCFAVWPGSNAKATRNALQHCEANPEVLAGNLCRLP